MAADPPTLTIRRAFPRLPAALVRELAGAPTGCIADARGREGGLDPAIRPVIDRCRFAGSAVTVSAGPKDNLAAWAALELCREGDVVAISTGGYLGAAVIGDVYAGVARNRGVVAIITDGLVRDAEGLAEIGIPVFARGLSPASPFKRGPGEVGLPIALGGQRIECGDLLAGDRDGIVHVPSRDVEAMLGALDAVREKERAMDEMVQSGGLSPPWLREALDRAGVRHVGERDPEEGDGPAEGDGARG